MRRTMKLRKLSPLRLFLLLPDFWLLPVVWTFVLSVLCEQPGRRRFSHVQCLQNQNIQVVWHQGVPRIESWMSGMRQGKSLAYQVWTCNMHMQQQQMCCLWSANHRTSKAVSINISMKSQRWNPWGYGSALLYFFVHFVRIAHSLYITQWYKWPE